MSNRILFIIPHLKLSNGVARTLVNLVNNLDCEKYNVTILVLFAYDTQMLYQINSNVCVQILFGFYFRGFQKIINLIPARILYKVLVKQEYDFEVAYSIGLPTKILAYSTNRSAFHFCWMHGYDDAPVQIKYYNRYDKIICVSKENKDKISKKLINPEKAHFLYSIVDQDKIKKLSIAPVPVEHKGITFIAVSRITKPKGLQRILAILNQLIHDKIPQEFYLWIIGDGPELKTLKKYVSQNHIQDYVFFSGEQENPYKYIEKADFFICCSDSEGLSTSCVEAAILGKPIISTDVGGAREIINMQGAGQVVSISTEALKIAVCELLSDTSMQSEWVSVANRNAHYFFKEERIRAFEQLFDKKTIAKGNDENA